jgi:hypothetical protein
METLHRLNHLIERLEGRIKEYWVTYVPKSGWTTTGYVRRGYYFHERPANQPLPEYGTLAYKEYVNGKYIGSSYDEAREFVLWYWTDGPRAQPRGEAANAAS